jgi:hypothetical protein
MAEPRELESEWVDDYTTDVVARPPRRLTRQSGLIVFILVVAGIFDALSGNPIDSILLIAVGLALAWFPDGPVPQQGMLRQRLRTGGLVAALALATAFAIVVGTFERYTWPTTIGVLAPGVTGLTLAWRGTRRRDPGPRLDVRQVLPWMVVFVTLGLFELTNLLLQPGLTIDSYDHPTLSVLSDEVMTGHLGRSVGLFVWLLLGAYLLDR